MFLPARPLVAVLALATAAAGCSTQKLVARTMAATLPALKSSFDRETSVRHAREAGPALLKTLDGFIDLEPSNVDLLLAGAEMNASFAFAFLEEEDPEWARALYARSAFYAGARMTLRRDVATRFWYASARAAYINLSKDDPRAIKDLPGALHMMEGVLAEDERFHFAGPHLFLGVYHGSRGRLAGGDPEKSRAHFERALEITGRRFLMVQLQYARAYAVQVQDAALFRTLLKEVLAAPPDLLPEQALANAVARQRAGALLGRIDDLFLDPGE